jgi:hypothetical protein
MIADKGHPTLGGDLLSSATLRILEQVPQDRPRRHLNPHFQAEFPGNARLTPGGIVSRHGQDELAEVLGNPGSADGSGFPTPEQLKALAMPTGKRLRSNHH